jgi:hypothetical protein
LKKYWRPNLEAALWNPQARRERACLSLPSLPLIANLQETLNKSFTVSCCTPHPWKSALVQKVSKSLPILIFIVKRG